MFEEIYNYIMSNLCMVVIILLIVFLILITILVSRKIKGGELPPCDMNLLLKWADYWMRTRNWRTRVYQRKKMINVTKDSFSAANIYFKEKRDGKIIILSGSSAGTWGWIIFLILFFVSAGFIAFLFAIILHFMSRSFAKNEVVPLIIQQFKSGGQPK